MKVKPYYVYTPDDGNEDGVMNGYTLAEAKRIAQHHSDELAALGHTGGARVIRRCNGEIVWGC